MKGMLLLVWCVSALTQPSHGLQEEDSYGVDVSFPMHYHHISTAHKPLGDGKQALYDDFLQGCRDYFDKDSGACDWCEKDRITLNINQPPVSQNYTNAGYAKIRAPALLMDRINEFWNANKDKQVKETWPKGNTYTNQWESGTYMLSLRGQLRREIPDTIRPILEAWGGQDLVETSLYGIRIYKEGSILAPHVDRPPLVTSAILNVDQDVDEPWLLEVIDHDGVAHNITMQPGDLVLYESHSVIHGRPFPLKGRYYANIFVHFEPRGYTERYEHRMQNEKSEL